MSRVHLHQLRWNQFRPLYKEVFVAVENVIERELLGWLRVSLRDEKWLELVFKRRHEDIGLEFLVDSRADNQFAQVTHFI